jgi:hypothetical protein
MTKDVVKKSLAIIGEGETEWFYFDSLRTANVEHPARWRLFRVDMVFGAG